MTFYHFGNCMALSYLPFYFTYKYSGMSDYGGFWKCFSVGGIYLLTQLIKMLMLATFAPMTEYENEPESTEFEPFQEFLHATIDVADLVGLYLAMQRVSGKPLLKILVAGLGWVFSEFLLTKIIFLWVGARGIEFDWVYVQKSWETNISLIHFLSVSCLIYLFTKRDSRRDQQQQQQLLQQDQQNGPNGLVQDAPAPSGLSNLNAVIAFLLVASSYKNFLLGLISEYFGLSSWVALIYKAMVTSGVGLLAMQIYVGSVGYERM